MELFNVKFDEENFDKDDLEHMQDLCLSKIEANNAKASQIEKSINASFDYDGNTYDHKLFIQTIFNKIVENFDSCVAIKSVIRVLINTTKAKIITLENLEKLRIHEKWHVLVFLIKDGYCENFKEEDLLEAFGLCDVDEDLQICTASRNALDRSLRRACTAELMANFGIKNGSLPKLPFSLYADDIKNEFLYKTDRCFESFRNMYCREQGHLKKAAAEAMEKEEFLKNAQNIGL